MNEMYKILQGLEAWIERAMEEVTDLNDEECSYEYERACAWLGTLEDRRTRLLQRMGLDAD